MLGVVTDVLYENDWSNDQLFAANVASQERCRTLDAPAIFLKCSIHCDGEGTLYTLRVFCYIRSRKIPDLSQKTLKRSLKKLFVYWIPLSGGL